VDEFIKYVLDEAITPLLAGVILIAVTGIAILQRSYLRQIALLRKEMKTRDSKLAELQDILHLSKVSELQSKVAKLNPQPRRRLTPQQKSGLAKYGKVPEGRRLTLEIIHDMAGSDCSAYANDFRTVFNAIVGWSISRSAVLRPGWIARCGLGVHVQDREILSRPETLLLNALAAAGIDYDLIRIPELNSDLALLVTPVPAESLRPDASHVSSGSVRLDRETKARGLSWINST
jgi:hypothetical protein